jgi:hypothetical protein
LAADTDLAQQPDTPVLRGLHELVKHEEQRSRLNKHLGIDVD